MSFLNPLPYVRAVPKVVKAVAGKAVAGRSYYVDAEGRTVAFDEAVMLDGKVEHHCPNDAADSESKGE